MLILLKCETPSSPSGVRTLYRGDRNNTDDILCEAASRQIVYGSSDTLHNGAVSFCLSKTLNKLVADVSCVKVGEYEYVRFAGNG